MRSLTRALMGAVLLLGSRAGPLPARSAPAAGHTYTVNSTLDQLDADSTDGVCASTPGGVCTLRAAIMESNFVTGPNTITVPSGVYLLTLPGQDDGALAGDLDLSHAVNIFGAGSGSTIIDGNSAVTGDRVFHILPTAQHVYMQGLTIRGGHAPSPIVPAGGGGLYLEGGQLTMYYVTLEGNSAQQGGALATADGVYSQVGFGELHRAQQHSRRQRRRALHQEWRRREPQQEPGLFQYRERGWRPSAGLRLGDHTDQHGQRKQRGREWRRAGV